MFNLQTTLTPVYDNDEGYERLIALTCGSFINFLSVGLMIFCTLFKL